VASPVALKIPNVRDINLEVGSDKYDVRFRFDWDSLGRLLKTEKPDVVFAHQVELTSHFRALIVALGLDATLVTYCHYWPIYTIAGDGEIEWDPSLNHSNLAQVILLRILSAALTSDYFFVTSEYARSLLMEAARRYNVDVEPEKVHVLPCPADPDFLSTKPRELLGTKKVLYNHRLYRQYGTEFFIDIASYFEGSEVEFVVTDFFSYRGASRKALDPYIDAYRSKLRSMKNVTIREDGDIREVYRTDILLKVDLGVGPYRLNANWSMSAVDCLGLGIPVIYPNIASFPEFVPKALLFRSKDEAIALMTRLLSNREFWTLCSRQSQAKVLRFTADNICTEFLKILRL
jgi:hypothetical protein